jgi:hypothetical protein
MTWGLKQIIIKYKIFSTKQSGVDQTPLADTRTIEAKLNPSHTNQPHNIKSSKQE